MSFSLLYFLKTFGYVTNTREKQRKQIDEENVSIKAECWCAQGLMIQLTA